MKAPSPRTAGKPGGSARRRQGLFFSVDAILAVLLLFAGLFVLSKIYTQAPDTRQLDAYAQDLLAGLGEIRVYELAAPWVQAEIRNGNITNLNNTVLFQIGEYWATNKTEKAQNLSALLVGNLTPYFKGVRLTFDGEEVYNDTRAAPYAGRKDALARTFMVSGVTKGKVVRGSTSSAYLRKIRNKRTKEYIYFGGFVGQGVVTQFLPDLPSDVNASDISSIVMELDAAGPFRLFINGDECQPGFSPTSADMEPDAWNITGCAGLLVQSRNNFTYQFTGQMNESFFAGGFVRVDFLTDEFAKNASYGNWSYGFPAIEGVANLYDGFYVPGTLYNMTVRLHFRARSNDTVLFTIGEKTVYENLSSGQEQTVLITDNQLKSPPINLDYEFLSNKTIPLRFAAFNTTQMFVTGGDADIVLITDFTGSMKKAVRDWTQGNLGGDCNTYTGDDLLRRTLVAQCLDKELVNATMNFTGNRLWPVFIYDDRIRFYNNPTDRAAINGYIDSFPNGKGKTCISCALNQAYEILKNNTNSTRKKFIVLMSDGTPTHTPTARIGSPPNPPSSFYINGTNATQNGSQVCAGLCDTSGACGQSDIPGQCSECTSKTTGELAAYFAANRSVEEFNATIFTVGFGPLNDCSVGVRTLQQIANMSVNGSFQVSNSSAGLRLIYENISQEILSRITLSSQSANVLGNASTSILYADSNISFSFAPVAERLQPNEISLTFQTPQFGNCSPAVEIPGGIRITDAKAVSYSGMHWTDGLLVNGNAVYNLSDFFVPYSRLGDPYQVQVPVNLLFAGLNALSVSTGDNATNSTGCSSNNSLIYAAFINASTARSPIKELAAGCNWTIAFEDGTNITQPIPEDYAGPNNCSYTNASIAYNLNDAYDVSVYAILRSLDYDHDGRVIVNLEAEDLEIIVAIVAKVPFFWGPSLVQAEVWR